MEERILNQAKKIFQEKGEISCTFLMRKLKITHAKSLEICMEVFLCCNRESIELNDIYLKRTQPEVNTLKLQEVKEVLKY